MATSGVRVLTSIDKNIQKSNFFALQSELSRIDVRLLGYDRQELQKRYAGFAFGSGNNVSVGQFLVARIVKIEKAAPVRVLVTFARNGDESGNSGIIDEQGLMPLLSSLVQYKRQRWSHATVKDMPLLLEQLQEGDLVYVAVRDKDPFAGEVMFNLEKYPELQGASMVMQRGKIIALAGGMDNYYYNRAVSAKRPMGSVVKPLVYAAAIQLGWNSLDPLNNERDMFVYQNDAYIPRPDHKSPHKRVSMSWAGVHSENVASVWLLYHLCDRLTPAQFKELLTHVGMARQGDESYQHYKRRVRDKMGIVVNNAALQRAAFEKAIVASEADLIFAGKQDELHNLQLFHYSDEFEELAEDEEGLEGEVRRQIVNRNYMRYRKIQGQLLAEASGQNVMAPDTLFPGLYTQTGRQKSDWWRFTGTLRRSDSFIYSEKNPGKGWKPVLRSDLQSLLAGISEQERKEFWQIPKVVHPA